VTIKAYFYDPTGEKRGRSRPATRAFAAAAAPTRSRGTGRGRLRVLQDVPPWRDRAPLDTGVRARCDARVARLLRPVAVVLRLVTHARAPTWGRGARATQRRRLARRERRDRRLRELDGGTGRGRRGRLLRLAMDGADRRVVVRDLRSRELSSSIAVLAIATTAEPKHEPRLRAGNPVSRSRTKSRPCGPREQDPAQS
jgi:hypothetical protein